MIGKAISISKGKDEWLVVDETKDHLICFSGESVTYIQKDYPYTIIEPNEYFKTFAELDYRKGNYDKNFITLHCVIPRPVEHINFTIEV